MNKLVKIKKFGKDGNGRVKLLVPKHNNIIEVNNALAITKGMFDFAKCPKRRIYRRLLIQLSRTKYKNQMHSSFPITHKDIKRLEYPIKREIPVNIFDILEIIVGELKIEKSSYTYRATPNQNCIISVYLVKNTLALARALKQNIGILENGILEGHPNAANVKYRDETNFILQELKEFDKRHPQFFNDLFV